MLNTRARAALIGVAVFIASMLGVAQSARAAVYRGSWDPAYGAPFTDLGWKGTATFFIPDACLSGAGTVLNTDPCSNGGMKMLGATVSFYNATLDSPGLHILETLTFSPPPAVPLVYSMQVTNHVLTAVGTGYSNPVQASNSLAGGGNYYFALQFFRRDTNNVALFHMPGYMDASCSFGPSSDELCGYNAQGLANQPIMTLTQVPEPATVGLVLAGLGAIGLTMRRRRV